MKEETLTPQSLQKMSYEIADKILIDYPINGTLDAACLLGAACKLVTMPALYLHMTEREFNRQMDDLKNIFKELKRRLDESKEKENE